MQRHIGKFGRLRLFLLLQFSLFFALSGTGHAIPAFARMYGTSCSTCHLDFPKLNDFGKAFKDAGFKFPKDDESMLKIPPVMLGAPANKELWPKAIWPGTIQGIPPIGFRYTNYFQYTGSSSSNFSALTPAGSLCLRSYLALISETGVLSLYTAGNFGSDIAFWVNDDLSVASSNANGGLGDAYLKFVNVGRFLKLPQNALNLRAGQFELDLPFTQARSIWTSPYDIYIQSNIGAMNGFSSQQFVNNHYVLAETGRGVELSGGLHTGGYNYSIAFIDQNTGGGVGFSPYVPTALGSNQGGLGVQSNADFKDIYASFQYRFNLERDEQSRNAIQAAGASGPRDHTYLNLGTYYFYGRSVQRLLGAGPDGTAAVISAREPFYRVGGNMTFNYRCCLQFNALYMYGHDVNLLPIDGSGNLIPLQSLGQVATAGFVQGTPVTFSGGFADVEWLAYPWMMVMMRYDGVNSTSDRINGLSSDPSFTGSPFNAAFSSTPESLHPGRAISDSRQHQGDVRIPVPPVAICHYRQQSADGTAHGL